MTPVLVELSELVAAPELFDMPVLDDDGLVVEVVPAAPALRAA